MRVCVLELLLARVGEWVRVGACVCVRVGAFVWVRVCGCTCV